MRLHLFLLTAAVLSSNLVARADSFTFTGSGVNDMFTLPSSPTVTASGSYGFVLDTVPVDENGIQAVDRVTFFDQAVGGGLLLEDAAGNSPNGFGAQLYTGANNNPTFRLGTFALSGLADYNLTIRNTTVTPEPSADALLGIGLLGVAWLMKRRFTSSR